MGKRHGDVCGERWGGGGGKYFSDVSAKAPFVGRPLFGSVTVLGVKRFERFRSSVPGFLCEKGFLCVSVSFSRTGWFLFQLLENGSGGSCSAFSFIRNQEKGV